MKVLVEKKSAYSVVRIGAAIISNLKKSFLKFTMNPKKSLSGLTHVTKKSWSEIREKSKGSIADHLQFSSTSMVNILIVILLLIIMLGLEQTNGMIRYGYDQVVKGPLSTTIYFCLFSYAIFLFSRFALQIRNKSLQREGKDELASQYEKDDPITVLIYATPMLVHLGFMIGKSQHYLYDCISYFLIALYLLVILPYNYLSDPNEIIVGRKRQWINDLELNNPLRRSEFYTIVLIVLMILIVLFYFIMTSLTHDFFHGNYGIPILDITLLFLISLRLLFLVLFLFYKYMWPRKRKRDEHGRYINNNGVDTNDEGLFLLDRLDNDEIFKTKNWWFSKANLFSIFAMIFIMGFLFKGFIRPKKEYNSFITYPERNSEVKNCEKARIDLNEYCSRWLNKDTVNNNNIYLVAGQGGGSRAGFWIASTLAQLDNKYDNFYKNLFAVSTVSGSSVGAGIYLNYKRNIGNENLKETRRPFNEENLSQFFNTDYVTSSLLRLFFLNPIQKAFGLSNFRNRNNQLILDENTTFLKIFYGSDEAKVEYSHMSGFDKRDSSELQHPLFLANTYNIDESIKSVVSPVKLTRFSHEDLMDSLDANNENLRVGEAINLSQMFPILSASAIVNNNQYYDGGIYDNSGLSTLRDVYKVLKTYRDEFAPHRKIVVFYCENGSMDEEKDDNAVAPSGIATLIKAASGSIFHANTSRHKIKLRNSVEDVGDIFLEDVFSNDMDVTLNRWVSKKDCWDMWASISCDVDSDYVKDVFKEKVRSKLPYTHKLSVYFNPGESKLSDFDKFKIDTLLNNIRPVSIKLTAFSDSDINPEKSDDKLLKERYETVRSYLSDLSKNDGVNIVEGDHVPNVDGNDKLTRQLNRRVDMTFTFYSTVNGYFSPPKPSPKGK